MIERGSFYVVNDIMVVAHDYERIDGRVSMWNRIPSGKEALEVYRQALRDCGYRDTTEDYEDK